MQTFSLKIFKRLTNLNIHSAIWEQLKVISEKSDNTAIATIVKGLPQ